MFEKLTSLREESHRQFSDIINSHSGSISKGINELVQEVSDLKAKLSVNRKATNVLLETIDNLNAEIRQLNPKLTIVHTLPEPEENHDSHIQEEDGSEVGVPIDLNLERPGIHLDIDTEEVFQDNEDTFDTHNQDQKLHSSNDCNNLSDPPTNELTEDLVNNVGKLQTHEDLNQYKAERSVEKHIDTRENHSEDYVCPHCNFSFSTSENLAIHVENVHPNLDASEMIFRNNEELEKKSNLSKDNTALHEITVGHKERNKKYKCEECPYTSNYNRNLKAHIDIVHKKIRRLVCEE